MASCFNHECEVILQGSQTLSSMKINCSSNPGHFDFISARDFTLDDLPSDSRSPEVLEAIKKLADRTVKVSLNYTSLERRDTWHGTDSPYPFARRKGSTRHERVGTGFIMDMESINGTCVCPECKLSGQPKESYAQFRVDTAAHVVYDVSEAINARVELFYDTGDEEKDGVKVGYGVDWLDYSGDTGVTDSCVMLCVSHDLSFADCENLTPMMDSERELLSRIPAHIIVSHPHGMSKQITVGKILHYTIPNHSKQRRIEGTFKRVKCYSVSSSTDSPDSLEETPLNLRVAQEEMREVPPGTRYEIPQNADYLCRAYKSSDDTLMSVAFPPGTKFMSSCGASMRPVLFPETTIFYSQTEPDDTKSLFRCGFAVYDTPTCSGSSGAMVTGVYDSGFYKGLTHAGVSGDGTKRSSYWFSNGDYISTYLSDLL